MTAEGADWLAARRGGVKGPRFWLESLIDGLQVCSRRCESEGKDRVISRVKPLVPGMCLADRL